jgi:hypothetical protein
MAPPAAPIPPAQMPYGTGAAAPYGGQAAPYAGQAAAYGGQAAPYGGHAANPYAGQRQFAGAYPGAAPGADARSGARRRRARRRAGEPGSSTVNVGGIKIPFKLGGRRRRCRAFKIFGSAWRWRSSLVDRRRVREDEAGHHRQGQPVVREPGRRQAKKPDGDKLIAALATPAEKWKKDAIWWSANFQAVDAEGRVDVVEGRRGGLHLREPACSRTPKSQPQGLGQEVQRRRRPACRTSGPVGRDSEPWDRASRSTRRRQCTLKDVMAMVGKQLPAGKTVRVTFDPKFADFYAWRVLSDDPKLDTLYAFSDCSEIK